MSSSFAVHGEQSSGLHHWAHIVRLPLAIHSAYPQQTNPGSNGLARSAFFGSTRTA